MRSEVSRRDRARVIAQSRSSRERWRIEVEAGWGCGRCRSVVGRRRQTRGASATWWELTSTCDSALSEMRTPAKPLAEMPLVVDQRRCNSLLKGSIISTGRTRKSAPGMAGSKRCIVLATSSALVAKDISKGMQFMLPSIVAPVAIGGTISCLLSTGWVAAMK